MKKRNQLSTNALKIINENPDLSVAKTKDLIFEKTKEYYSDTLISYTKNTKRKKNLEEIKDLKKEYTKKLVKLLNKTFEIEEFINV